LGGELNSARVADISASRSRPGAAGISRAELLAYDPGFVDVFVKLVNRLDPPFAT
jgi:hypothetical protein